jgi:hypothetical protein
MGAIQMCVNWRIIAVKKARGVTKRDRRSLEKSGMHNGWAGA